jgi:hypothetical protein
MDLVVSPYHLTTREPAALAAMLLADRVITMLPTPLEGKAWGDVRGAAERVPRYMEFMQSWRWTIPLWKAGVIVPGLDGQEAVGDLRAVCERIDRDERLAPLRALMKAGLFEDHELYLDAVARDLLKAGPDPGITVPVAAGMDMFALRHGAMVARSDPSSVVQKAEAELGSQAFAAAVPVLLQADGEWILEVREMLKAPLQQLRRAFDRAIEQVGSEATAADVRAILAGPAKAYADAFESQREEILAGGPDDEVRVTDGTVMLTGLLLPMDCVLESSLAAMRSIGVRALAAGGTNGTHLLKGEVGKSAKNLSLYVRVLGRPAPRAARR